MQVQFKKNALVKRSWFKNDDESVNDDRESIDGGDGVSGLNLGTWWN